MVKKHIYFNHDGGVDDLVSLFLLLKMDNVELTGVSVIPADCYLEPAVFASRKIIDRFGSGGLDVAESNSRGKNPFPKDWRMHAFLCRCTSDFKRIWKSSYASSRKTGTSSYNRCYSK